MRVPSGAPYVNCETLGLKDEQLALTPSHIGTQRETLGFGGELVLRTRVTQNLGTHLWYYGDTDRWLLMRLVSMELRALSDVHSPRSHLTTRVQ